MAWNLHEYGRKYRKEADAHQRSQANAASVAEPTGKHRRKAVPTYKRRFGIERRYIGPVRETSLSFLFAEDGEWHMNYSGWYEKERDRDNALIALRKNCWRKDWYEYRAVDR